MVECHLAKVDVEGSNPFSRSPFEDLQVVAPPNGGRRAHEGGMREREGATCLGLASLPVLPYMRAAETARTVVGSTD